jgi:hypothetical protein
LLPEVSTSTSTPVTGTIPSTVTATMTFTPLPLPSPTPTPKLTSTAIQSTARAPVIHELPGYVYETLFSIPAGKGSSIQYRIPSCCANIKGPNAIYRLKWRYSGGCSGALIRILLSGLD